MRNLTVACLMSVLLAGPAGGLTLRDRLHSHVSRGNRHYEAGLHEQALEQYSAAEKADSLSTVPHFNSGDALYRLGRYPEGAGEFLKGTTAPVESVAAMSYYNLGNSLFRAGDMRSAVEAYKKALLIQPDDQDTKHNLELAMRIAEQQQDQDQDEQQQDRQESKDQDQQQQQQDQEQQDQQQEEQQDRSQQEQDQAEQQPQPGEISPEELERILAAIEASDKNTQEELLKHTAKRRTIKGKDW